MSDLLVREELSYQQKQKISGNNLVKKLSTKPIQYWCIQLRYHWEIVYDEKCYHL